MTCAVKSRELVASRHAPEICAQLYAEAIETFYAKPDQIAGAARCRAAVSPPRTKRLPYFVPRHRQILTDKTAWPPIAARCFGDLPHRTQDRCRTGIAGLMLAFLDQPPEDFGLNLFT